VRRLDHVVLNVGSEAVLRAEECEHLHVRIAADAIGSMTQRAVDRRGIADNADPAAGYQRAIGFKQAINAEFYGR
jgi:hypothetical protein